MTRTTRQTTPTSRDAAGHPSTSPVEAVSPAEVADLLEAVRTLQAVDARMGGLLAQGRIPAWRPLSGAEGVVAGTAFGLREGDWLLPGPRWPGPAVTDEACGRPLRVLQPASPGASRAIHAVGIAQAARLRGEPHVAVALLSEGALAQSDIHSALNFAAVRRAPCVLVVTTGPALTELPAPDADAVGAAYGVRATTVDGGDVLAVVAAVRAAADRARAGGGPTLIRAALTPGHDATAALAERAQGVLGALGPEHQQRAEQAARAAAERAAHQALTPDTTASLLDHVLTGPHPLLEAQLAAPPAD